VSTIDSTGHTPPRSSRSLFVSSPLFASSPRCVVASFTTSVSEGRLPGFGFQDAVVLTFTALLDIVEER
jgi:hypothetical protein